MDTLTYQKHTDIIPNAVLFLWQFLIIQWLGYTCIALHYILHQSDTLPYKYMPCLVITHFDVSAVK